MTKNTPASDRATTLLEFRQGGQPYLVEMATVDRVVSLSESEVGDADIQRLSAEDVLGTTVGERDRQGLIVQRAEDRVMLVVDRVHNVLDVSDQSVFEAPRRVREAEGGRLLRAFVERNGELVVWLDTEAF